VILGDVSGKGLRAAMAVSLVVGMIRALADHVSGPGELLAELNRRLYGRLQGGFVTCIALRLDSDGICLVSSAGHPPLVINGHELGFSGSLPLGLVAQDAYEEGCLRLKAGDHLALYTDGLLEAKNTSGELYGFDRLHTLFAARPDAAKAVDAAVSFGQDDDITVLTLVRLATGQESTTTISMPTFARRSA
jgi:serine phosphatase RsbU (regulator of sigma subunit)